jgi:hypothetical protein
MMGALDILTKTLKWVRNNIHLFEMPIQILANSFIVHFTQGMKGKRLMQFAYL